MSVDRNGWGSVADTAAERVAGWITTVAAELPGAEEDGSSAKNTDPQIRPDLLEGSRRDTDALGFTHRLLDSVIGASDPFSAALGLRDASRDLPQSMPAVERLALRAGGIASLGLPWAVLPVARKWLRDRVSHLVVSTKIDAERPIAALERAAEEGRNVIVALTGRPALGDASVQRETQRVHELISRPEVSAVAVDVSRLVPEHQTGSWSLDHDAIAGAAIVREILEVAQAQRTKVVLESSDYRASLLAPQLLLQALAEPGLERVLAGVRLPAELPESLQTANALIAFSKARVAAGATPLEVTIGVAGFAGKEQISAILTGLPAAATDSRIAQQAQLMRVAALLLQAGPAVRTVVATEDPHLLAAATVFAERVGSVQNLTLQLRSGVASTLETAILENGFKVRRRQLLVTPKEFSGTIDYLVALAAETADADSATAHVRALFSGEHTELATGVRRMREVLAAADEAPQDSRRVQQRNRGWSEDAKDTVVFYRSPAEPNRFETGGLTAAVLGLTRAYTGAVTLEVAGAPMRIPAISESGFANEPDTDASRFENRDWVRELLREASTSDSGIEAVHAAEDEGQSVDARIESTLAAAEPWRELRAADRSTRISRLALAIAAARDHLLKVLAAETGAPVHLLDNEINTAVDVARYYGQLAAGLGAVRGARFHPDRLAVVVADAGVPLSERAEATLAALAAGSAVVLVAHPSVARSSAVLLEEWRAAGLPSGVVELVVPHLSDDAKTAHIELATAYTNDERVERALVLGARDTAQALLRSRPDLRIEGRFRGTGLTVIAPSADPTLAIKNVITSAFHALHADSTAARGVVLLGHATRSQSLKQAFVDAVASLRVGDVAKPQSADPLSFDVGPLPDLPGESARRALTELDPGEEWWLEPQQLDDEGLLWQPGIRAGLTKDARFWGDAVGLPVIGVMNAHSMAEAIALTNCVGSGGVAGLQAGDPTELLPWLDHVSAARLVVGRPTTGGKIERHPFGGWRAAGAGSAALAGGPHRLQPLGSWELREGTSSPTLHLRGLSPEVRVLIETSQSALDYQSFDRVRRAALSDALTWRTSFGRAYDVSGLGIERNLLRHWPVATHVRLSDDGSLRDLVRVLAAGFAAVAPMTVSTGVVLPQGLSDFLARLGVSVALERDNDWLERVAVHGPGDSESTAARIRLIGGDRKRTAEWLSGLENISIWADQVTMAGPVELLAFVREQAVSIEAHRHGLALLPAGVGAWIADQQGRR